MNRSQLRKKIFKDYANNLKLVLGQEDRYVGNPTGEPCDAYICPACKRIFVEEDLNQSLSNPLTLEHVGLSALNDNRCVLTCKKCNNNLGSKLDSKVVKELYKSHSSKFRGRWSFGDINPRFEAEFKDGKLYLKPAIINLEEQLLRLDTTTEFTLHIEPANTGEEDLRNGLMRIAFLRMFYHFGYDFLLSPSTEFIRRHMTTGENVVPNKSCGLVKEHTMGSDLGMLKIDEGAAFMILIQGVVNEQKSVFFFPMMGLDNLHVLNHSIENGENYNISYLESKQHFIKHPNSYRNWSARYSC
jgi:hypothetical protein